MNTNKKIIGATVSTPLGIEAIKKLIGDIGGSGTPFHYTTQPTVGIDGIYEALNKEFCSSQDIKAGEIILHKFGLYKVVSVTDTYYSCTRIVTYVGSDGGTQFHYSTEQTVEMKDNGQYGLNKKYCSSSSIKEGEVILHRIGLYKVVSSDENRYYCDVIVIFSGGGGSSTPLHYSNEPNPTPAGNGMILLEKIFCSSEDIKNEELIIYNGGLCKKLGGNDTQFLCNIVVEFSGGGGTNGKDGVSCTHYWSGTTLYVTSASGTSSANLKGEKGDTGAKGDKGDTGEKGAKGDTGASVTPLFANSISECTDTSKLYVLPDGYIYAYKTGKTVKTVTEQITGTTDNPWGVGRLSSGNPNGTAGYVTTPYIDLTKYSVPFELHLEGIAWVYTSDGNRRWANYDASKTHIKTEMNSSASFVTNWKNAVFTANGDTAVIDFTPPVTTNTGAEVSFARFSGQGTEAEANVYITYEAEVTSTTWINTGHAFAPTDYEDRIIALEEAVTNGTSGGTVDENIDINSFTLTNPAVKAFMATADYSNSDYSYTNVTSYTNTNYYRADIPFPVVIGWNKNSNAVQYTISINSQLYYTTDNKISIYNLIPNKTYSYTVYAICANGSTALIKSGSFTTTASKTRMLNIDGIQNVRDIGGYTGSTGAVKYGLIYRGSAMDEAVGNTLHITDDGKKEMLCRVGIKTDLDLRGANNVSVSALGAGVDFYTPTYSYLNYVSAITSATAKADFKNMLEYIVTQLGANKPIYIHCSGGCDRTGTLVFLLLGLLGVSESDLAKEYELSSFSAIGQGRCRNSTVYKYKEMVSALTAYSGTTITDKFYNFAIDCGVSADTITSFRNLMLG